MCLVDVFYPRLVHFWLLSAVGRDVENPVTDDGFDAAPVSHAFLQPEATAFLTRQSTRPAGN
jgi:hypothetical protein